MMCDEENNATSSVTKDARTGSDWRKIKDEYRARKRKLDEAKLIKKIQKEKKRKAEADLQNLETESISAGRHYTVSIALPGSILNNAQSPQLETYLVGQIARAASVFNVDEIVVFDETGTIARCGEGFDQTDRRTLCCVKMARILQYLECPQYLRKTFFPVHKDLQYCGLANSLDSPHHMRENEDVEFREGVVVNKKVKEGRGSYVNVGQKKEVQIDVRLNPLSRVTVHMKPQMNIPGKCCRAVAPTYPRTHRGLYWGYNVRLANSLGAVRKDCPYRDGYDIVIGTSENGTSIDDMKLPKFKHMMVVFGGLQGLEASVDADPELIAGDMSKIFHHYINTCPDQGSRTIRTEEAILVTMSALRPIIAAVQRL